MAQRYAVVGGNWSATTTWDGLTTLPAAGDDVYANTFAVVIDQNVTCVALHTNAGAIAVAGGSFANSGGYTVNANVVSGSTPCLLVSGTASPTVNGNVNAGASTGATGITYSATAGTLAVNGNITGGTAATTTVGVLVNNTGTLNVIGNVVGGSAVSTEYGINITGAGVVTVVGTVNGGTVAIGVNATAGRVTITTATIQRVSPAVVSVQVGTSAALTLNGNVVGGNAASGNSVVATGRCTVNGNLTGGSAATAYAVSVNGIGAFYCFGSVTGATASAMNCDLANSIYIEGTVTGSSTAAVPAMALNLTTMSDHCIVKGNVVGGSQGVGILNSGTGGDVRIIGSATDNGANAYSNTGGGTVTVIAISTASPSNPFKSRVFT